MKNTLVALFILCSALLFGQDYWQQEVNYKIKVQLDDVNHILTADEEIEYINNSPDVLNKIYIHLWPNAYRDESTALAKQLYENRDQELTFGSEEIRGHIDSLDFKVNGKDAKWYFEEFNQDICIVELGFDLKPGQSVKLFTPFVVKIPSGSISRLGHIGQSYQITQWFPKPAVYDKDGWHHMPYLNQGEFYSEYGSFDVSITIPSNYVVGATGDLKTVDELEFLVELAEDTEKELKEKEYSKAERKKTVNTFPESSKEWKTIRYTQSNVHDFAWFADKRYKVLRGKVKLPHSGKMVTSWAMFTPKNELLWKDAIEYINDAVHYYSLWNGDYPYNNVTAVDGTISAGGGMEYPNITVIGNAGTPQSLEVVIVHEVGHNWFYGQLGTNERVHGWMDEGMNTLNEVRYMQTKYPDNTALSDAVMGGKFHFNDLNHHDMSDVAYRMLALLGEDQPIETHSARFTQANYGVVMYQKTGLVFFYLKDYLGEDLFNKCMQEYYREWEFKHPQPEDMRRSLEKASGKDLSWLFDDLIQRTDHIDYKLKRVKQTDNGYMVTVKNTGQVDGPIEVNGLIGDSVVSTKWIEPGQKKNKVLLEGNDLDKVMIDHGKDIPEIFRQNNTWIKKGLLDRVEPYKLEALIGDNESDYSNVFWTPMIGGNYYDKLMLGVAVHNYGVPFNRFGYLITPMFSFGRKMVSGMSELSYTFLPAKGLKTSRFGVSVKSFKNDTTYRDNESYYIAVQPYWTAKIGNRGDKKNYTQNIRLQGIYKKDKYGPTHIEHAGAYIQYDYAFVRPDHKVNVQVRDEYYTNTNTADQLGRVYIEGRYRFRYMRQKQKRWIDLRLFAGQQYIRDFDASVNGYQYSMSLAGASGQQDIFVDEYYFGRNNIDGIWSQQRQENMGGFKSTSYYGTSSIGLASANLFFQFPLKTGLLGFFADAGVFHNGINIQEAYQFGLGVRVSDFFGVYFPLYMSDKLLQSYGVDNLYSGNKKYGEMIRFTLKMNVFNKPLNLSQLF